MADDVIIFPDTWEEFEKQYGFYDIKQVYTYGNTKLIPSFRVQQWLDHIADIERKKQSQENKMSQVAKLFGKKLGEEFAVKNQRSIYYHLAFTDKGLTVFGTNKDITLRQLFTGQAVIIDE